MMDEPVDNTNPDNDQVHLLYYVLVLAKYSRMIVLITAAVVVLTYLNLFRKPNSFTATATFLPPQQNLALSSQILETMGGGITPGAPTTRGLASLASGMIGLSAPTNFYVSMMTTETVSDRIINRFNLMELFKAKYYVDARRYLEDIVKITASKEGFITVKLTHNDPQQAATMANTFVEELHNFLQEMAIREAKTRLSFLEKELAQINNNLSKAEETLRTFSEKNSVVQIDAQTKSMIDYIANMRAAIDSKEVQIGVLRQQATPFNYDLIRLETELKGMKERLKAAESQYDQSCIGDICLATSKMPTLALEYIRLYRDLKFQENLYQHFAKMVEVARLDMVKEVAVIQVIDKATPPERRSNRRLLPSMLNGAIAFILLVFVAFIREAWQNRALSEGDARRLEQLRNYARQWLTDMQRVYSWFKKKKT